MADVPPCQEEDFQVLLASYFRTPDNNWKYSAAASTLLIRDGIGSRHTKRQWQTNWGLHFAYCEYSLLW